MAHAQETIESAKRLYVKGSPLAEIAQSLGIGERTIRSWAKAGNWQRAELDTLVILNLKIQQLLEVKNPNKGQLSQLETLIDKAGKLTAEREQREIKKLNLFDGKGKKRKRGKKNDFSGIELESIKKPSFFKYQEAFLQMKQTVRFVLKSRRVGFSFVLAWEGLITALTEGRDQIFISASKNQVGVIRKYIRKFAREYFNVELAGKDECNILNLKGEEATFYFLSTNSNTTQGYGGDLYIDEFCWIPKVNDILDTAKAMSSHEGYRVTYISTPSVKTHPGYLIWEGLDERGKKIKDGIGRMKITLLDALKQGCTLFKPLEELKKMFTPRQWLFLFMCEWVDNAGSIFKMADLEACAYKEKYTHEDGSASMEPAKLPEYRDAGNVTSLGYDPNGGGIDGDNASYAIGENRGKRLRVIDRQSFNNASIDWQCAAIRQAVKKYKVRHMAIDCTGVGLSVWNKLKDMRTDPNIAWRVEVVPLNYTWEMKQKLVLDLEQIVARKILEFSAKDQEIINAFLAIKSKATRSGSKTTFVADRKANIGHADLFWAIAHLATFYKLSDSLLNAAPAPGCAMSIGV